jgi:outer membrane receptor protein involved in Fe transport
MNGLPVPSPEPEKKSVPLDLFTSGILESITAYKTYTPDLPGSFAGGSVNIKTKAYPDSRVLKGKAGLSGKSSYLHADFRRGGGGKLDYFGFDDGTRSIPDIIPEARMLSEWSPLPGYTYDAWKVQLGDYGKSFRNGFEMRNVSVGQPLSLAMNFGNRYVMSDKFEYGFYTNISFSNSYSYREELYRRYAVAGNSVLARTDIMNEKSAYATNLSLSGSAGCKIRQQHKLKLYMLYTHNSESSLTFGKGRTPNLDERGIYIKDYFAEKSILNTTLNGEHVFDGRNDNRLEWAVNTGTSRLREPDVKSHNYKYISTGEYYEIARSSAKAGQRYFTRGYDRNLNADVNHTLAFHDRFGERYAVKAGGRLQYKDRDFGKRIFYHEYSGGPWPADLLRVRDNDFGAIFDDAHFVSEAGGEGLILLESTDVAARNAYRANEAVAAAYVMSDIPLGLNRYPRLNRFRFTGGFRYEYYVLRLIPYNPVTGTRYTSPLIDNGRTPVEANIREYDILPAGNLQYTLRSDMKLRVSYSKTVARPEFREIAPFEFQQFYGGSAVVGYPYLKTTDIYNYDLRYEWYYGEGELLAAGVFYKNFINPIEISQIETADESYLTYQNALYANTQGLEIDIRMNLPFVDQSKGRLTGIFNCTLSRSTVRANDLITLFNGVTIRNNSTTLHRSLQGQSDIMANATISYTGFSGWNAALVYNTFSKRLSALGSGSVPNEYEMPFHSLNMTLSRKFNGIKLSLKAGNLLNSRVRFGIRDDAGELHVTREYRPGVGYGMSIQYVF